MPVYLCYKTINNMKEQKTLAASKAVEFQQASYRLVGQERYYFTAQIVEGSTIGNFGEDVYFQSLEVDKTEPIWMEVSFDYEAPNSQGQTVLAAMRVDENLKGVDYRLLISYLNDQINKDQCEEIDFMPDDAGFTPYYSQLLVSIHDPELPGVVVCEAA
jgi:hypothetical protein